MTSPLGLQRIKDLTACRATLKDIINNHDQSPHLDRGRRTLSKWSMLMDKLVGHLPARRPSRERITDSDHAETLWSLFMCCILGTLERLKRIPQEDLHCCSLAFEEVLERVQFHIIATELLIDYYRRETARSQPSARDETSFLGRKYAEDSAALKIRTKEFFGPSAPERMLSTVTVPASDVDATIHMTSQDWPIPRDSVVDAILQALLCGTRQAAPGYPDLDFSLSLRLATSALAKLREELDILATPTAQTRCAAHMTLAAFRCVFLVFVLTTSGHISDVRPDDQDAVGLILEYTMRLLNAYDEAIRGLTPLVLVGSFECTMKDPFKQEQSEPSPLSQFASRSLSSLTLTSSPLSLQTRYERYNEDKISPTSPNQQLIDQAMPRGAEIEVGRDQTIEMNVANLDPQKSMADQKWVPAQLRIFLDESDVLHTYRLTICRGNSLLTDHIIQPTSTKIVPNYAFNIQPPAIWFDTLDENFPLCFSPKDPSDTGVRDLLQLQDYFVVGNKASHFACIDSFTMEMKNGSHWTDRNLTAQIWRTQPTFKVSAPASRKAQPPNRDQPLVLIFASSSIFVIPVADEIAVTRRTGSPTIHLAAQPRDKWLSVYRLNGNERSPPGLDIIRNANILSSRCSGSNSMLATIELRFPNIQTLEVFRETLAECQRDSIASAQEAQSHRDFQRNPIVKTTSTFRRKP